MTGPTPERVDPPLTGDERSLLRAWLDWHRATLTHKCAGLTDEELHERSMPPSTLSLLGLVRHMAEVERTWFRRVIGGEDIPLVYSGTGDFQRAYDTSGSTPSEAFDIWRDEVERSRAIEAAATSLDVVGYQAKWDAQVSLRWVMLAMIHEYARHNGHADLLREGVDGATGT